MARLHSITNYRLAKPRNAANYAFNKKKGARVEKFESEGAARVRMTTHPLQRDLSVCVRSSYGRSRDCVGSRGWLEATWSNTAPSVAPDESLAYHGSSTRGAHSPPRCSIYYIASALCVLPLRDHAWRRRIKRGEVLG